LPQASGLPRGENFPGGLTAQPSAEHVSDPIQFLGDEGTESPREVSFADGLYLLEVEGSGFQERFEHVQLSAAAFSLAPSESYLLNINGTE
jgi:hypothetical protein